MAKFGCRDTCVMRDSLSFVVVTVYFEGGGLMLNCLRSLRGEGAADLGVRVVVAGDASREGSAEWMEAVVREGREQTCGA